MNRACSSQSGCWRVGAPGTHDGPGSRNTRKTVLMDMRPLHRPTPSSAAAAALGDSKCQETSIVAAVCCSDWLGPARRFCVAVRLAREHIRPPARVFHFRVGVALDYLHCHEPRSDELTSDHLRGEE